MAGLFRRHPQPQQRPRRFVPAVSNDKVGSFVLTGGGVLVSARRKAGFRAQLLTGGGVLASARRKGGRSSQALTGGGIVTSLRRKGGLRSQLLTGGGVFLYDWSTAVNKNATFVLTGGGVLTSLRQKGGRRAQALTGGGAVVLARSGGRQRAMALTGGGRFLYGWRGGWLFDQDITGGGILAFLERTGRLAIVNLTGGGQVLLQGGNLALTDLGAVMDAIAMAITDANITERAYPYPAESISVPCAVVAYPDRIEFDVSYQRGADQATFPVYFIVGRAVERAARDKLATIITGATGIKDTLDGDLGGAVQSLRVTDMRILKVQVSGIDYLAAEFNAEVLV
jgi:hypothetical protein